MTEGCPLCGVSGEDECADDCPSRSDFWRWLEAGMERGWVSRPTCATHDGVPSTEDEDELWEAGHDPCQHVVRLWPGEEG